MVICLERGTDCLHMVQLMPLHPETPSSLASFKSRLVLPFWYQLTKHFAIVLSLELSVEFRDSVAIQSAVSLLTALLRLSQLI